MMFRNMRRANQQMTQEACITLLNQQLRGMLAIQLEEGYPYVFPMDYFYRDGKIYFHCAKEGQKLDALRVNPRVSFCVLSDGVKTEDTWALTFQSVICFGTIRVIEDLEEILPLIEQLGKKGYPNETEVATVMARSASKIVMLELTIEDMSGKQVVEK